jgi:hypothetical protein
MAPDSTDQGSASSTVPYRMPLERQMLANVRMFLSFIDHAALVFPVAHGSIPSTLKIDPSEAELSLSAIHFNSEILKKSSDGDFGLQ